MDVRLVSDGQNQGSPNSVTILKLKTDGSRNALPLALVNISGDIINPSGAGSQDGAVNDGADSSIKASVLNNATSSPTSSNKSLVVQFADGISREVGKVTVREITSGLGITGDIYVDQRGAWATSVTGDVLLRQNNTVTPIGTLSTPIGVQVIGGSLGAKVSSSGDTLLTSQQGTIGVNVIGGSGGGTVGVSGDVSTIPKSGQTWPISSAATLNVSQQGTIGVQVLGGSLGTTSTGDTYVDQRSTWATSITGDVAIRQDSTNTPKGTLSTPIGVNIVGGSVGGKFSSSGDTLNTSQQGVVGVQVIGGSIGARMSSSGDTLLTSQQGVVGVQVVGGQIGGAVGVSGDVTVKPSTSIPGNTYFPVSGDQSLSDGVTRSTKATVKSYTRSNPLTVAIVNASGDHYNSSTNERVATGTYGVKNITTSATLIIANNPNRVSAYVQNVEGQQMYIGFDSNLTVVNGGIILSPTTSSSGDGGNFSIDKYTGPIYGILASGDADSRYMEL